MLKYLGYHEAAQSPKTEVLAGGTTFLAMVYIVVVNPSILSDAGMDFGAVFVATCLAAAFGSLMMGVLGRYPIALAPGMGQNAFFSYVIVLGMGYPWQTALGAVLISGIIFIVLSVLPIREWLFNAIPMNIKYGISAGIGFFIGFIALKNAGIVIDNPATLVSLGPLTQIEAVLCLGGFILIAVLSTRGFVGAIIFGIGSVSILGWLLGVTEFQGLVSAPPSIAPVFMQFDLEAALTMSMVPVILALLLVDVFDTAGTMVAVSQRAGLLDEQGKLPNLRPALLADSGATAVGALLGTSSTTSFIESAAGVEAGGRSGLTAVVVGGLFLCCLFFAPLAQSIPAYATSAALLFVACLMVSSLKEIDWTQIPEYVPAVVGALAMPLTFSIADGIGLAFITYALIRIGSFEFKGPDAASFVIAGIFLLKYLLL
ncbi:NCS2 family permease [Pseudomonadales bacterium]|nr:NCS2 family permease [Pseudomonadales bacterium]MDA8950131.1 NCS2 family permease [Pseudomonadales bacterium]MDA9044123.1 NCS2 family permease [Pseudomonadales bacterium]MDB2509050.1 NCS2 family permease [Pseudomonadales bacterium]MDB3978450.1 NCS2 family permease [Pseudomonadales bacterium]